MLCLWTIYQKQRTNKNVKEKENSKYNYQNELDKTCFQFDVGSGDFESLPTDKVLRDKEFNIAKNPKLMVIKELIQWFKNILIKKIRVKYCYASPYNCWWCY